MKVLLIVTVDLGKNGISTCVLNYCKELETQGLDVDILAPNHVAPEIKEELSKQQSKLYEVPCRNSRTVKYFLKLCRIIKREKYDIVHVHGNSATMAVELTAAFLARCPVRIAHSHNTTCEHQRAHKLLLPIFNKMYTAGAACGTDAGKWLFGSKGFSVIPNGIPIEKYKYSASAAQEYRRKAGIPSDQILLGHIGLFNYQKNHEFLIKMFAALLKQSKEYMLLLVGNGELYGQIKELADRLSVSEYVRFAGNENDIPSCLSAMDLFVMPSRFEGLPYVLVEAQASALPCVVSEAVTKEADLTGLVDYVEGFSEENWARTILEHKKGHDMKNIAAIKRKLREKGYDIEYNGRKLREFYIKCLGERKI